MRLENHLIQIAGVLDQPEARMLQECGVRYLGFPLRLPVNKEDLSEEDAAKIIRHLEPPFHGVLITYLNQADEIADLCRSLGAKLVQLHGDIPIEELKKLKTFSPLLVIIKSLVVGLHTAANLESTVNNLSCVADAFITDTYDPTTGASGATGKTHDWCISRRLVEISPRPVILAGGLTPWNVRQAILEVRPAGVDAHTGVEDASGRKSREKLEKFVSEATVAFNELENAVH